MHDSFLATHERPGRLVLMDAVASFAFATVWVLFLGGVGAPESWFLNVPAMLLLLIRRIAPVTFLFLATVLAGASFATGFTMQFLVYCLVLVGAYGTAAFAPKRLRLVGFIPLLLAVLLLVFVELFLLFPEISNYFIATAELSFEERLVAVMTISIVSTIAFVAAWALGMLRRSQLMDVVRQRERADLLERDAHRLAELAVTEERTRISREMHDIIAHSLASILTLAEGGRMGTKDAESAFSNQLFGKISDASRSALSEVKVLLRQVDAEQDDRPTYGAQDIRDLAEGAQLAGLPLTFEETGEARTLPAGHSLAVYRVAQESITNILKHAPGCASEMTLHWGGEEFVLVTRNELAVAEGFAIDDSAEGKGLVGMRERIELFDGEMQVAHTQHMFEIRATWPYPAAA
ncbi:MAG: sensor histidine kinase [Gulosibacter sp.]|uniref:sensor histidine kinase n=1 Tax=Gulosibacter sp. TaxID=2817531 RepID=UPI003F9093B0